MKDKEINMNEVSEEKAALNGNKKRKKSDKPKKLKNKNAFKRSTYVVITTVILIAILVAVNILSTVIADRFPTTIDATADSANTLSDNNIKFLKSINEKVEIIVCASREAYTGSEMVNYAYNNYYVQENATPYNYYNQTITLLESCTKYNSNISLSYVDTQSPTFTKLESESDIDISFGDIIVRCTRKINGKETTLSDVLVFDDIYNLQDNSGGQYSMYGYTTYSITSSDLETSLASAIYSVASSESRKVAFLKEYSKSGSADEFLTNLATYNYEVEEISGKLSSANLEDVDMVLLVAPTKDLTGDDLKVMDKFLENNGKKGKSFIVFGSVSSPATPNINDFMEEWGIGVKDGIAYETNSSYRIDDSIYLLNAEDDFTKTINNSTNGYASKNNIALSRVFEENGSRKTHILMTTTEYGTVAPKGTTGNFKPNSDDDLAEVPVIMVTEDTDYDENVNEISSYVGYFGSEDFISSSWSTVSGAGNMEFAITVANNTAGRSDAVYFDPKITRLTYMTVTDSQIAVIRIISLYTIPLLVLIGGILVWILRKNR